MKHPWWVGVIARLGMGLFVLILAVIIFAYITMEVSVRIP